MAKQDYKKYALLLEAAKNGSSEAFRELYRQTYLPQFYYLQTFFKEPEDAKDALQEVYVLLYQNMDKIHPPTVLVAYLNRLSYYVGKNMAKKLYRRNAHLMDFDWMEGIEEPEAEERLNKVEQEEQSELIRNTIERLPEAERSVLFMRYFQNLKHQEVALSLGISQSKAKRLQNSAHIHMRELLKKQGFSKVEIMLPGLACSLKRLKNRTAAADTSALPAVNTALAAGSGSTVLFSGIAAVGLSLALVGGGSFAGKPDIISAEASAVNNSSMARVEVKIQSALPIREVVLADDTGKFTDGERSGRNIYAAEVKENGTYRITVTANNGKSDSFNTKVRCIDKGLPEAICTIRNGRLHVSLSDRESGIDYDDLYCVGSTRGRIKPETADRDSGTAVFPLPKEDVVLYVKDLAGNRAQIPVAYHEPTENP